MPNLAIGVDVGASQVKMVASDALGQVHRRKTVAHSGSALNAGAILAEIMRGALGFKEELISEGTGIDGAGFGFPCYLEGPQWSLGNVTNLPALENYPVRPALTAAFGGSVRAGYDTNNAGLAEFLWGSGAGFERVFFMGVGTGISASFFTRRSGQVGYTLNTLGESGHLIVDAEGATACACGGAGCLEAVAASPAIRRKGLEAARSGRSALLAERLAASGELSARDVTEAARVGDPAAGDILEETGRFIGIALTSYLHLFAPAVIILGGGVSLAGELLLDPVRRTIDAKAGDWYLQRFQGLRTPHYGLEAGAVGSACLVYHPEMAGPEPDPAPIAKTERKP